MTREDKAAATLAARTFRTLMAIAAAFDLEIKQYDALNAFVNSELDEIVYIEFPEGFCEPGYVLILNKALYGLRRAPRLWQKDFSKTLQSLGLTPVNEDICLFTGDRVIIMFFVDDILILHRAEDEELAQKIVQGLKKQYKLRDIDETKMFLGIQIIRDRPNRKLWLSHEAYINRITERYHLVTDRPPRAPSSGINLQKYERTATANQIHQYMQKVGSLIYPAVIVRPDIAKMASKLAEFNTNPGPQHIAAADHLIQYLYGTRKLAIEYSQSSHASSEVFVIASDAAYADNPDRKSSQGYICMLYGGPVDWQAAKQKTVSTSTTEAELLALSEAAKNVFWWKRLFNAIQFDPQHQIAILCDNHQTIRLLRNDEPFISTRLKHVDIHQHWLRQEVQLGHIIVK
jgi:hypothetical protein